MSHPASEQDKASPVPPLGLYVHVPFCASTCDFCAFYQTKPTAEGVGGFLAGIADEAKLVNWTRPVTTVFWGGGTPGLLSPKDLGRLAETVRAQCHGEPEEWTVELAPASVTPQRLAALREAGVTRISMGVQSFQPALLDGLGRQHTLPQIYRAYDHVRAAGFASVNLDLMFALPGQTEAEWAADVSEAVRLAPDHLSTYCLTFEEDTALWVKLSQGRVKLDPENEARLYEATWAQLAAAGYGQYEVANFARPGHACRHNLNTWRMQEWVGLGPSAASQYDGWRGGNVADLEKWLGHVARGERVTEDRLILTPAQLAEDALIFGLRMNAGVDVAVWQARAPDAPWAAVEALLERCVAEGLAVREGSRARLTERGRLLADSVGAEMMEAFHSSILT
ncbi:MAG: oxygen-independent coproporphyrinogen-3 oxidase [Verrucomicrobia bacterium]|jgi:oxygen-independent coproporphyrinogen III oxidase|nr:MAG: oxygen-independent coproporphyrinogen-3 oxidase [Verrucomicrobiota bacterium]